MLNSQKQALLQRLKRPIMAILYYTHFSAVVARRLRMSRRDSELKRKGETIVLDLGNKVSLELRARTTDFDIFEQIFLLRDCALPFRHNPGFIIDGGAHVGCSTVWFARKYPDAKIIAVEAERGNFEMLCRNTAKFPNVECVHAAIWKSNEFLRLEDPLADPWGFRVVPSESRQGELVRAVTVSDLLSMSGYPRIGLLKLDIEGAEKGVFSHDFTYWLPRTDAIIVELHDRISPGCTESFNSAMTGYDFVRYRGTRHNAIARQI
jgi:FkbM family methyltransferase